MLNVITDIFKPNKKTDSLFGVLKFRRAFIIIGNGYWNGEAHFQPLGKVVNVYVTAGKSATFEAEQEFYRQVEKHYPEIVDETLDILYDTILDYDGNSRRDDTRDKILANCELNGIILPNAKIPDAEWSLSYMYMPYKQTYSVYFDGWKPLYGKLDD